MTGKHAETLCVSLPADMVRYLRNRAAQEDRTVSRVVRRAIEIAIKDRVESELNDSVMSYSSQPDDDWHTDAEQRADDERDQRDTLADALDRE
jgi:hypothetical protein